MPVSVSHIKNVTIPDSTNSDIVRPSDWNSAHSVVFQPSGAELLPAFSNGGNVSFGTNTGGFITASAPSGGVGGVAMSAGTQSVNTGTVGFANSNGISFGMSGSSQITASHNGLTTARSSNDAVGLNTALTANGIAWTVNSSGLSLNVPAFLTTAALSDHSHGNPSLALTNISGTTASASNGLTISLSANPAGGADGFNRLSAGTQLAGSATTVNFANSNGISFGMSNSSQITASHNGLTTAMVSNASTAFAATGFTTTTVAGAVVAGTHDTAGLKLAVPSYLTTARASNDAIGLNTALTANGVAWTVNSSGISLNVPAFLTTAAQSNHSHGNPTLALTNLSGTTASASNGFTLSLSAAAPGGGGGIALANSQTTYTSGTALLSAAGGAITIASNTGQRIDFSVPAISSLVATGALSMSITGSTISLGLPNLSAYAVSNTTQSSSGSFSAQAISFHGAGGVSVGVSNNSVIISGATGGGGGGGITYSGYQPFPAGFEIVAGQKGQNTFHIQPMLGVPAFQFDHLRIPVVFTGTSNSSGSFTVTMNFGVYTRNAATLSLLHSTSYSTAVTMSGTVGSYSLFAGMRNLQIPWTSTFAESDYWVGVGSRTTTGGAAGMTMSQFIVSQINSNVSGLFGSAVNGSLGLTQGLGSYSVTTAGIPSAIPFSHIQASGSEHLRPPVFNFLSGTV
jgi:hypothetical protein